MSLSTGVCSHAEKLEQPSTKPTRPDTMSCYGGLSFDSSGLDSGSGCSSGSLPGLICQALAMEVMILVLTSGDVDWTSTEKPIDVSGLQKQKS